MIAARDDDQQAAESVRTETMDTEPNDVDAAGPRDTSAIAQGRDEGFVPGVGMFRIHIADRDDGGLRIWSDDVPGLVLSSLDRSAVWRDLGPAMEALIRRNIRNASRACAIAEGVTSKGGQ